MLVRAARGQRPGFKRRAPWCAPLSQCGTKPQTNESPVENDPGIIARLVLGFEDALCRKQEASREHELRVVKRFTSLTAVLDKSLAPKEVEKGRPFLDWAKDERQSREVFTSGLELSTGGLERLLEAHSHVTASLGSEEDAEGEKWSTEACLLARLTMAKAMCAELAQQHEKGLLRPGLEAGDLVPALEASLYGGVGDRARAIFPLFDSNNDGFLTENEVEAAVDVLQWSIQSSIEHMFSGVNAIDEKARKAMPKDMKWVLWDVMEMPMKRRCAFAWAPDRKQVAPEVWEVGIEEFLTSQAENFPELDEVAAGLMKEYEKIRWDWHEQVTGPKIVCCLHHSVAFCLPFLFPFQ
ncbi:unnamed protein product [Chrysoparadoxa australica]